MAFPASRYRGSALGFFWTLVNPIMLMFVYTFVFKNIFGQNAAGVPFQVYLMTGILAWNFFSTAAIQASVSLVSGASLVNKSTFPRIVLPASAVLANAVNYLVALPLLLAFILISGVSLTVSFLLCPASFSVNHHSYRSGSPSGIADAFFSGFAASHRSFFHDVVFLNTDRL